MITDWIIPSRVRVNGAERLYSQPIDWCLTPGVNVIVGGTGLGKTTFVYALQFGIFGKMVVDTGERIEREFFKDRLTRRSAAKTKDDPPVIEVQFAAGGSSFTVKRNLLTGSLTEASCDGVPLKGAKYEGTLAEKVGLSEDFQGLTRLQANLLFFGEGRHLLAWDNLLQNELLNLMLSDHTAYTRLKGLWAEAESADSEARNLSTQASRMEKELKAFGNTPSDVQELRRRKNLKDVVANARGCIARVAKVQEELQREKSLLDTQEAEVARAHAEFHRTLDQFESETDADLDDELLSAAMATPTIDSMHYALEQFYLQPNNRACPCCGRPGLSTSVATLVETVAASAQAGHCIICSKEIASAARSARAPRPHSGDVTGVNAGTLQGLIFKREQTRSRIESLQQEESVAVTALSDARAAELKFLHENPSTTVHPLRVAIKQLRSRQKAAVHRRDEQGALLRDELAATNAVFEGIQSKIARAFKGFASLYLDEHCDVEFLQEGELPSKRGPQIKAPHAAFFPRISGQTRHSASALSDAQRTFIDLAFRMAVLEVWHHRTAKTVTMIVETPEGAVDLAYMERVATMLRAFGDQGHTLVITTNLNNNIFLPEIMSAYPKAERTDRILNLLELGRPRKVQKEHMEQFQRILRAVADHPLSQ